VVNTFWPLMISSSPSASAVVDSAARSLPASGSVSAIDTRSEPSATRGRSAFRCSSVPKFAIARAATDTVER